MDPQAQLESLRSSLAEEEENLMLIEEQRSKYVFETDIPLGLIKQERRKRRRVAELHQRIAELEQSLHPTAPQAATATSTPSETAPPERFTTHIGHVDGPVHTGSGDIIIVQSDDPDPSTE